MVAGTVGALTKSSPIPVTIFVWCPLVSMYFCSQWSPLSLLLVGNLQATGAPWLNMKRTWDIWEFRFPPEVTLTSFENQNNRMEVQLTLFKAGRNSGLPSPLHSLSEAFSSLRHLAPDHTLLESSLFWYSVPHAPSDLPWEGTHISRAWANWPMRVPFCCETKRRENALERSKLWKIKPQQLQRIFTSPLKFFRYESQYVPRQHMWLCPWSHSPD